MNTLFKLSPALALLGCASTPVGYEAGTPADERDAVHRTTPAPRVDDPGELVRTSVSAMLAIPVEQAEDWFFARNLAEVIRGTDSIPGIRGTTTLTGAWGQPGDRRRVELSDDGAALEQVLENNLPEQFTYVIWNYTSDAAKYVEYGFGEFRFEAVGEETQVTWTYAFKPRKAFYTRGVRRFLNGEYARFMKESLVNMQANAEAYRRAAPQRSDGMAVEGAG